MKTSPTERFSNRVDNYVRFRPSYPEGVIETLKSHAGLAPGAVVADVGLGTGIFARLLLSWCARVIGVEPNGPMRMAAEASLAEYANFESRAGTAELTGLADASVDLVTAAQAFHWFDPMAARREFARILKPGGKVALVWNERLTTATQFLVAYEELLHKHATDYPKVNHANIDASALAAFFGPAGFAIAEFPNEQLFDLEGLEGRLLSSSYAPPFGHPGHEPMMAELRAIFASHEQRGTVALRYATRVYHGGLS